MRRIYVPTPLYESKPYACLALAVYDLSLYHDSALGKDSGWLLMACTLAIIYKRGQNRGWWTE